MATEAFIPIIDKDDGTNTCVQVTTATASAVTALNGSQVRIKCLTQPCYIRFSNSAGSVTTSNGFYMAVGDVETWEREGVATHLAYIRATSSDGALSIAYGMKD